VGPSGRGLRPGRLAGDGRLLGAAPGRARGSIGVASRWRYDRGVRTVEAGLVDIVREFLLAHQLLRRVFERHRRGELRFDEVQALAGDTEASALYRLKERCHALFRARDLRGDFPRVALFDLAVGSLFHEAMKLRENIYQLEVYAPKVEAAREQAEPGSEALFDEFARILAASRERLEEAFHECEVLLEQTRRQFRVLLSTHRESGLVTRYLLENASTAEEVLGEPLDAFLESVHGDPVAAYAIAARSYLESGFFDEARRTLAEALARDPSRADLQSAAAYADGMSAYLRGRYEAALHHLEQWADAAPVPGDGGFRELALAAVHRLPPLVENADRVALAERAAALAQRLEASRTQPAG
jgi:tetratricopeptide (TPR) repeat protein